MRGLYASINIKVQPFILSLLFLMDLSLLVWIWAKLNLPFSLFERELGHVVRGPILYFIFVTSDKKMLSLVSFEHIFRGILLLGG